MTEAVLRRPPDDAGGWAEATEVALAAALALVPVPLAAALASAEGEWKGRRAALQARAYRGARIRFARAGVIRVEGGMAIGNVLVLGRPGTGLPIFGMDAVQLTPVSMFLAADLTPVTHDDARAPALMAQLASTRGALPSAGELPAWARQWFTKDAIFARSHGEHDVLWRALEALTEAFARLALTPEREGPVTDARVSAEQQRYVDDHRTLDRAMTMLHRMFGAEWAEAFLEDVLFPKSLPP
jgi:hypothetical protein